MEEKRKAEGFSFSHPEPQPILSKDSARRVEKKRKAEGFSFSHPEPQPIRFYIAPICFYIAPICFYLGRNRYAVPCSALPCRRGNVAMPAWQRCYAGVATLLCRRGNVVMPAWQRCYAGMATNGVPCKNHYTAYKNENVLYRNGYIVLITKILEKEIRQTL
ncbi:MAG: hypothetical protein PUI86_08415, partial [Bacteroidales bacterium]|nr:hypothetical protein [Bacteroidales bacterium]